MNSLNRPYILDSYLQIVLICFFLDDGVSGDSDTYSAGKEKQVQFKKKIDDALLQFKIQITIPVIELAKEVMVLF